MQRIAQFIIPGLVVLSATLFVWIQLLAPPGHEPVPATRYVRENSAVRADARKSFSMADQPAERAEARTVSESPLTSAGPRGSPPTRVSKPVVPAAQTQPANSPQPAVFPAGPEDRNAQFADDHPAGEDRREPAAGVTAPRMPAMPTFILPLSFRAETSSPEVTIELAPGVREPAATLPHEGIGSPQQADALDRIVTKFDQEIAAAAAQPETAVDPEPLGRAWADAKWRADERYRLLFGDAAFNQATAQAAREALASQTR